MTSDVPQVGGFRIDGELDDLQLILLSDAEDELIRYRLTPEIVRKLAIDIPNCASQLADGRTNDDGSRSEKLRRRIDSAAHGSAPRD